MHVTGEMVVALILAFLGFVGTTAATMLHLQIRGVVKDVSIEIAHIDTKIEVVRGEAERSHSSTQLSLAELKTALAQQDAANYKQIMAELRESYWDRNTTEAKHIQNTARMDVLTESLKELRIAMDKRLTAIEERLPV